MYWKYNKVQQIFLSQNLSDYNNKIAFHCSELRRKRLIDATWAYGAKVLIKIQDNGSKEEIKHLSWLTRKPPDHIFNFRDRYSPLFTKRFLIIGGYRTLENIWCGMLEVLTYWTFLRRGVELNFATFFMIILSGPEAVFKRWSLFSEFRP